MLISNNIPYLNFDIKLPHENTVEIKDNLWNKILNLNFSFKQQFQLLEGIELFFNKNNLDQVKERNLSYLKSHTDWIAMRLYAILANEEDLSSIKIKHALDLLCQHPELSNINLENNLVPILPKDFEDYRIKLLGPDSEINQMWQTNHIDSLIKYQNHCVFYSPELDQYFIKYQGRYELFNEVIRQFETEFQKGNHSLYYLEDGLQHYDPENSVEVLPLFTKEVTDPNELKYKFTIISAQPKQKGISDLGHAWMRLQEPFEKDGKFFLRVYSIGWFLRGKFIIPDKYEFTPRGRHTLPDIL